MTLKDKIYVKKYICNLMSAVENNKYVNKYAFLVVLVLIMSMFCHPVIFNMLLCLTDCIYAKTSATRLYH